MLISTVKKIFGTRNDRELKRMSKAVVRINALEEAMQALDDAALRAKTGEFRSRLADGEKLEQLLPEAFAVVREAGVRALAMRHFDVQLIGGMALHDGKIAEMRTGEGKTLVATLPAYLNALPDHSVHLVTVNDYLAQRDAAWMGPLYEFLGLSVGVVRSGQSTEDKKAAMPVMWSMAPIMNLVLITSATIWRLAWLIKVKENWPLPSWMRWTRF